MKAYVKAISYHLPEQVFSNEEFFRLFPESRDNVNLRKLGISKRHIVSPNETASDLAVKSALKLFEEHAVNKEDIDFILFCSTEFDHHIPTTACLIQGRLGVSTHCGALDLNLGCSGYVYGLSLAKGLVETSGCKNVLLLTASSGTKTLHPKDKSSRYLFGDGAAATLISSRPEQDGIGVFVFGTDGKRGDKIIIRDGLGRYPLTSGSMTDTADEYGNITNHASFYMNGQSVFNFGLRIVPAVIGELLAKSGMSMDDMDHVVFHQTNQFMNDTIREKANIPVSKFISYLEPCGNTASSSIPIALYEGMVSGRISTGNTAMLVAFGSGLSWAATTIKL